MNPFIDQVLSALSPGVASILGLVCLSPVLTLLIADLILKFEFKAPRVMAGIMIVLALVGLFCVVTLMHQAQYVG